MVFYVIISFSLINDLIFSIHLYLFCFYCHGTNPYEPPHTYHEFKYVYQTHTVLTIIIVRSSDLHFNTKIHVSRHTR